MTGNGTRNMKKAICVALLGLVGCAHVGGSPAFHDEWREAEYIKQWLVCAPLPTRKLTESEKKQPSIAAYEHAHRLRGGHLTDYLKASGGEAKAAPGEGDTVEYRRGKAVKWKAFTSSTNNVSLESILDTSYRDNWPHHHVVMYGYTIIHSDKDVQAYLKIGTDDSGKAYLNGDLVYDEHELGCGLGHRFVPVWLKKGSNRLLVKAENCGGPGGFIVRITPGMQIDMARFPRDLRGRKLHETYDFLFEQRFTWSLKSTPSGSILRVDPHHVSIARSALTEAIESGKINLVLIPRP